MGNNDMSLGIAAEVRPAYVEDWLDTLPYADFDRTAQMLQGALAETNAQRLKPSQRFELLELYVRPYRYLLDNYGKAEVLPSVHALETKQRTIEALRRMALEMGFACRLAIEETLNRKTLWLHNKPSPRQLLLAIRLLSHVLVLSYQSYSPIPKNTWRELNEGFLMAEHLGLLSALAEDPVQDSRSRTSVLNAYLQVAATSLVDPHHLPQGAVWQIYDQLHDWAREIQVAGLQRPPDSLGHFVIDLKGVSGPVSLTRFDASRATPYHRMLNCGALYRVVQLHLEQARKGSGADASLILAAASRELLLRQMLSAWGRPPTRHAQRQTRSGTLRLAAGLNAAYFHVNGRREFMSRTSDRDDEHVTLEEGGCGSPVPPEETVDGYVLEPWSFVNAGPGGVAVYRSTRPQTLIRVGELVGMANPDAGAGGWVIGVVRWLMIQKHHQHRIGLQIVGRKPRSVALRATIGSPGECEFRRALLVDCPTDGGSRSLIAARGLYLAGRSLEVEVKGNARLLQSDGLIEATVAFEQFTFKGHS